MERWCQFAPAAIAIAMCSVAPGETRAEAAAPVMAETLLGGQRLLGASLSPDGHYLSMIISEDEHSYVAVKVLGDATPARPVLRADPAQHLEPRDCAWAGPTRMVCLVSGMARDSGGYVGRWVEVAADGSEHHILTRSRGNNAADRDRYVSSILDTVQSSPDELLIRDDAMSHVAVPSAREAYPGAGRYNLLTGAYTETYKPQRYAGGLVADGAGDVRLVAGIRDDTTPSGFAYLARGLPVGQSAWRELTRLAPYEKASRWYACCVARGTDAGYMLFAHDGHRALWRIDLSDQHDPEPVVADAERDVSGVLVTEDRRLLGAHMEGRVGGPVYVDPEAQAMSAELDRLLPGLWHFIRNTTPDMKLAVVESWGATQAPSWFLLDRRGATPKVGRIGSWAPGLRGRTPGRVADARYAAPDGKGALLDLVLPGDAGVTHPPLILWLTTSGDPSYSSNASEFTLEGDSGYSLVAQFLAARGYAVAFPHLRESGRTLERWQYPFADWGGAVYEEVLSAEHAALAAADADPARVCIIGEGFAGYTALVAASRHGEGLRCVAAINGVSELARLRKRAMQEGTNLTTGQRASSGDLDYAEPYSPRKRADQAHVPVLLLQTDLKLDSIGFVDTDMDQSRDMSEALRKARKTQALVLTHSTDEAYQREVLAALDAFLGKVDPATP